MNDPRMAEPKLGVDIGRVIIEGDGPDTNFIGGSEEDAMRAPAMMGVFESLARLTRRFERRVWLVSKCGPKVEARSRAWLEKQHFFERTSIARTNLRFCRNRKDKAPICKELGVQTFVDDRLDVLLAMAGTVGLRVLFGATASPSPGIVAARTWRDAERIILEAMLRPDDPRGRAS